MDTVYVCGLCSHVDSHNCYTTVSHYSTYLPLTNRVAMFVFITSHLSLTVQVGNTFMLHQQIIWKCLLEKIEPVCETDRTHGGVVLLLLWCRAVAAANQGMQEDKNATR